jgi:hypothetical protein
MFNKKSLSMLYKHARVLLLSIRHYISIMSLFDEPRDKSISGIKTLDLSLSNNRDNDEDNVGTLCFDLLGVSFSAT